MKTSGLNVTVIVVWFLLLLQSNFSQNQEMSTRGIVMCSGSRHLRYIQRNVFQIRRVWNSTLPFVIAHCGELSRENEKSIQSFDAHISFLDLCESQEPFGISGTQARKSLRGFYCKIGALLSSPFDETIVMDMDVVWFKSPDLIFDAPGYQKTGTLFMRERMYLYHPKQRNNFEPSDLLSYFESEGIQTDKASALEHLHANEISLFWQGRAQGNTGSSGTYLSDYQDSCVVVVNKPKHPILLKTLLRYLRTHFVMGYGDKELFWIAATVSREPFAFEPFISGQYRDCYGVLIHFDPSQNEKESTPFFMNGEFLVERGTETITEYSREVNWVGEYLQDVSTRPLLATATMQLVDTQTWKHKHVNDVGCTCLGTTNGGGVFECVNPPSVVKDQLLLFQWLTYSSTLVHTHGNANCVPVMLSMVNSLNAVMTKYFRASDCPFVGCPFLPIELLNVSFSWMSDRVPGQFCDPIDFEHGNSSKLQTAAHYARSKEKILEWNHPKLPINHSVSCPAYGRKVYLIQDDGLLHLIPNLDTFVHLGLDFGDTHKLPWWQFETFEIGEPVPIV